MSDAEDAVAELARHRYVGFWRRSAAVLIDTLVLLLVMVPLLLAIYGRDYMALVQQSGGYAGPGDFAIQVILPAVAVIVFWRRRGATPGKMLIGARIVDAATGGRPTTGKLVLRYFAYIVSTFVFFLGFVWIAFDAKKQGWHDKIAGTVVIEVND